MDRDKFMAIVYDLLKEDLNNNRANNIIDAADEYAQNFAIETAFKALELRPAWDWLMGKADEWGMVYGKQFLIEAQKAWEGEENG
jgi:hypothetical protein